MSFLLDLVVPGSGVVADVLLQILDIGNQMFEVQDVSNRLHRRLDTIFRELETMKEKGQLPKSDALNQYVAVVGRSLSCLEDHNAKMMVYRFIKYQALMDEIHHINEEIDMLFKVFNLASTAAMMEWKQQWESEIRAQQEAMAANTMMILREIQDSRAQTEALFALKYELQKKDQREEDKAMKSVMSSMESTIMRVSKVRVEELPPWYLPADDVKYDANGFAWGSYGSVHRGVWDFGTKVVVKCFNVDPKGIDERDRKKIEAEMNLWFKFNHPNVIKMFGACHVSVPPFIVCEDASNGDLCSFLTRSEAHKRHMWRLLFEAAQGLGYIHKQNVVHGDLKLNNILVGADGQAKMSDFGLSTVRSCSTMSKAEAVDANSVGALRWRAPECLTKQPVFASDVYSFAMCIIEAVTDAVPFYGLPDDAVRENLRNGNIPDRPDGIADGVWELVVGMTHANLTKRMSLQKVIERLSSLKEREQAALRQSDTPKLCSICNVVVVGDSHSCANGKSAPPSSTPQSAALADVQVVFSPPSINNTRITALLKQVQSAPDSKKEKLLLDLVQECADNEQRAALYAANGVQLLMSLIRSGQTFFTQAYALECLDWDQASDSRVSKLELDGLRDCIRDPELQKLVALKKALQNGTGVSTTEAIVRCACTAVEAHCEALLEAGVIEPLTVLLRKGTDTQKLWATEALRKLTRKYACRLEAVEKEAIGPLVSLILVGTEEQKHRATWALGNLAKCTEASSTISQKKAIPALVALLGTGLEFHRLSVLFALDSIWLYATKSEQEMVLQEILQGAAAQLVAILTGGTDEQKVSATSLINTTVCTSASATELGRLGGIPPLVALLRSENTLLKEVAACTITTITARAPALGVDIVQHGAIAPLVQMLQSGTELGKENAARALMFISFDFTNAAEVVRHGAIPLLVPLVTSGTDEQKSIATNALGNLGRGNIQSGIEIAHHGAIAPLVLCLTSEPKSPHTEDAVVTLQKLASGNPTVAEAIANQGAVGPLSQLLQAGSDKEKKLAALTLSQIAINPAIGTAIMAAGAIPPLIALVASGTDDQKEICACVLADLTIKNAPVLNEIVRQGAIDPLIALLDRPQGAAAHALGCIAQGGGSFARMIARQGAIPLLVKLLGFGNEQGKICAAVALGDLARSSHFVAVDIIDNGAVPPLRQLQQTGTSVELATAVQFALRYIQPGCCLIS